MMYIITEPREMFLPQIQSIFQSAAAAWNIAVRILIMVATRASCQATASSSPRRHTLHAINLNKAHMRIMTMKMVASRTQKFPSKPSHK